MNVFGTIFEENSSIGKMWGLLGLFLKICGKELLDQPQLNPQP